MQQNFTSSEVVYWRMFAANIAADLAFAILLEEIAQHDEWSISEEVWTKVFSDGRMRLRIPYDQLAPLANAGASTASRWYHSPGKPNRKMTVPGVNTRMLALKGAAKLALDSALELNHDPIGITNAEAKDFIKKYGYPYVVDLQVDSLELVERDSEYHKAALAEFSPVAAKVISDFEGRFLEEKETEAALA